jgi:hypothetical protein
MVGGIERSSKRLGMTLKVMPACSNRYLRRGDWEARMIAGIPSGELLEAFCIIYVYDVEEIRVMSMTCFAGVSILSRRMAF